MHEFHPSLRTQRSSRGTEAPGASLLVLTPRKIISVVFLDGKGKPEGTKKNRMKLKTSKNDYKFPAFCKHSVCVSTDQLKQTSSSRYKVPTHGLAFYLGLEFGHSVQTSNFCVCKSVALLL